MAAKASWLALALFIAACERGAVATTAEEAVQVTNRYWAENLPQVDLRDLSVETMDKGDRWRVTYRPPEGSTGGPFIYEVDKKTGKIVHSDGGQ